MSRIAALFRWFAAALVAPVPTPMRAPAASHSENGCADPLRRQHRRLRTVLSVSPKPWRRPNHDR